MQSRTATRFGATASRKKCCARRSVDMHAMAVDMHVPYGEADTLAAFAMRRNRR
jgi:hypothetical protein